MNEQLTQYATVESPAGSPALAHDGASVSSGKSIMPEPVSNASIGSRNVGVIVRGRFVRIAHADLDKYEAVKDPEVTFAELRRVSPRIDIFTFMQTMADKDRHLNFHTEPDNLAILPISTFENWWNHQIRSFPRNRARQAEKRGVVIKEVPFDDELVHGIWEVYNETKVRQGKPNSHYGKNVATVGREAATYLDRSVFIAAFFEGKIIGFVKLILDDARQQASLMNIAAMVCHRDKAPTNALIAWSVRACVDRGIPYLMYQNFEYGAKGEDSLTHFKEINGFERIELVRYYVPLTAKGRLALALGMHKKLANRLPRFVVSGIRAVRNAWYNRNLKSEAEAS